MRIPPFRGNVIVSNLPSELSSEELAALFDGYGLVLGAKIDRWHDRPGGAQGQIDLAPDTSVENAVAGLDGYLVGTHKITVKRAPKHEPRKAGPKAAAARAPLRPRTYELPPEYVTPTPSRKVVVEYRAPRKIVIPPRATTPR